MVVQLVSSLVDLWVASTAVKMVYPRVVLLEFLLAVMMDIVKVIWMAVHLVFHLVD